MKNNMTVGRLMLAALLALSCVLAPMKNAGAITSVRSVTANLKTAAAGGAIVLRNGESLTYQVLSGSDNGPNVNVTALQKSCDGINFGDFSVPISTTNNSHDGTFSATIPVENCAGGKMWARFAITSFTTGLSSTTITEVDNVVRSFYNNAGESVLDILDGGTQDNGYNKIAGALTVTGAAALNGGATITSYFVPYARTLAQIKAITPTAANLGGIVTCTDCASAYSVCTATGATIQGFKLGVSGALAECK